MTDRPALDKYRKLKKEAARMAEAGDSETSAGMTYWSEWSATVLDALCEHRLKYKSERTVTLSEEARKAIVEAFDSQPVLRIAATILQSEAKRLLGALKAEATELDSIIREMESSVPEDTEAPSGDSGR